MSLQLNKVIIAGNLTRDPMVKFIGTDTAVANFGLAINRKWKDADGQQKDETTFIDVEAWGRTAELVGQYLVKGRGCLVEGRLKLETWEDKASGAKRNKIKVVADQVHFTDSPKTDGADAPPRETAAPAAAPRQAVRPVNQAPDDDSPPF